MGRRLRPQLPEVPFHVTARVQGRAPLFDGIERFVAARIVASPRRSDAALLAFAVMPNHLHVLLLQGQQPLAQLMQPLLRTIALLVQLRTGNEGHVFERRFHAAPCLDPDYFRNAVAYVHLNAVRAGLSASADEYEWCSHAAYRSLTSCEPSLTNPAMESVLRLFAARDEQTLDECRRDYRAFLNWRCAMDAHIEQEANGVYGVPPARPCTLGGDIHWTRRYAAAALRIGPTTMRHRIDLRDIARATINDLAPGMDLELLRSGDRGRAVVRVRRRFILSATGAGHAGGIIARFLRVSPTTVSSVRSSAQDEGR